MMMRTAFAAVFIGVLTASGQAFGANAPQTQKNRPKVKVTFDRASFQASYGQTLDLCMKIVPKTHFTPLIQFGSDPAGAVTGQFGGSANCADSSWSQVQIVVSTSSCVSSASLLIKVHGKPVTTLPGSVILPTSDTAVFFQNHTCAEAGASGPGGIVDWTVEFKGLSGANFNGLFANETVTSVPRNPNTDPPECGITPTQGGRTIGEVGPNQVPDNLGTCGTVLLPNCQSVFLQTIAIGACTVQRNKLYFEFSNQTFYTKREDPSGSTQISSPPIPQ